MSVDQMSLFTALLALLAGAVAVVGACLLATASGRGRLATLRAEAVRLGFSVAAVATAGSLWFSEVGGFVPCEYCWYQRILMYPLVVVFGVEAWRPGTVFQGDRTLRWRALPFSVVGLVLSGYHAQLQWFPEQGSSCDVAAPCTQHWVDEFGFVSIPVMAFLGFAAITVLVLAATVREDAGMSEGSEHR